MAKEIEPKLQTIGVYLNKKSEIFRIPEYQRGYSWNISNCGKLWQDVESYSQDVKFYSQNENEKDPYFFGTIIIDCSMRNYLNLIDGQQRTITFLLLLKAMHLRIAETLRSMPDTDEARGLQRSLEQSQDYIFEILYRADVRKQLEIEEDWDKARGVTILENVSNREDHKDELKNIIEARTFSDAEKAVFKFYRKQKDNKYTNFFRNFKFFYDKLGDYKESKLDVLARCFLHECQIIEIKSWRIEQAVTMFNSLNSTGMPLTDADIISAQLFSHAHDTEEFGENWKQIESLAKELDQKKVVDIDGVLQQFMYITRAVRHEYKPGELNTPGIRKYYMELHPELLKDPMGLCGKFNRILRIWNDIQEYPITKLLLKFNENFKLFLMPYLFRVPEDELSEQNITPVMECFLRLFALLEAHNNLVFSSSYFKTFLFMRISN